MIDTCRRARLTDLENMDWDGCSIATVASACGQPVLQVTARTGARFVTALRPSRKLTDSETKTRLAEYYGLRYFFADLKPIPKHKLKRGAEIFVAMRRVLWGPSVRSYVKGGSQCAGCMDSKANGTNFHREAPELKAVVSSSMES